MNNPFYVHRPRNRYGEELTYFTNGYSVRNVYEPQKEVVGKLTVGEAEKKTKELNREYGVGMNQLMI